MNKAALSERDICTKYITPALERAGWNRMTQFREEVSFTDGRIYVRGKMTVRGKAKRADYVLYHKLGIPLAVIEAKDNSHSVRAGIQQALDYATTLDVPFVFSSNGDGFLFHDKTARDEAIETELTLDQFPSPELLWAKYTAYKQLAAPQAAVVGQAYYTDGSGRQPRYYQQIAINRCVEAIAKGQNRLMLVMATGTGKTYTAFQIIHRLWKAGVKKRILFLADRNSLIDQTARNDFKPFRDKMTTIRNREVDKSYQVYLALYQGLSSNEADKNVYRQFSPDFFDLIVVDECHRGSASEDSAWREILTYFGKATHLGLTATPKETHEVSSSEYFGAPVYTYSLKQGIDDGFLAPYRVVRVTLNVDAEGWRPTKDKLDKDGNPVEDRVYNRKDYDRTLVIDERTAVVAAKLTEYLKQFDRFAKTIVFCTDIDHAERMRSELARLNADLVAQNHKYVMQITGDNDEGKRELDNFISVEERYPVIAVTSELMTTGVDAQTCKVIVLDANISSMTKFKQIIGRGTRIREEYGKLYFTILDFRNATDLFADPTFDGEPEATVVVSEDDDDFIIDGGDWVPEMPENPDFPEADPKPPGYPISPEDNPVASEPRKKVYVNGVDVSVLLSRELHFNQEGKPVTISLVDYSREILQGQFASLDGFLTRWNTAARKHALIEELKAQGVLVDELREAVADRDLDLFDLLCYVAWGQPPLTRAERTNNVKKRDVFAKYGELARKVMYTLLEKYADEGLENIESMDVLKVRPLTQFGSPVEIIQHFGGKDQYLQALAELENALYQVA